MSSVLTVTKSISRPASDVYRLISDPENLPRWSLFVLSVEPEGEDWRVTTQSGVARMRFIRRNELGVVDHWVRITPEVEIYVPLRVVANGDGSEVLFTVFRLPGMDDAAFEADVALVRKDLDHLKAVLESQNG